MFKNSAKMMFMSILIFGTLISISANSWLSAWMGLEINLLAFIPLMNSNINLMSSEASLKYFLTQALASSVIMFTIIISSIKLNMLFQMNSNINLMNMMLLSALMMKSGAAPFHFWFPSVMEGITWLNALILMTWQKIAPMMLISYTMVEMKMMLYPMIMLSIIVGSLGGLNQTSLRKLMSFSSINHLGWMIAAMSSNENLWLIYFSVYSILSINLIIMFNLFKLIHINQLFMMFSSSKIIKFSMALNMLSLGGLPPFLGFLPKWLVIQALAFNNQSILITLMTVMTLITLFFYMRLCYSMFMLNYFENSWMLLMNYNKTMMYIYLTMTFISIFWLFTISLMYSVM